VWDSDYPWDIRVEKICSTLINYGYEVHLVCRNRHRRVPEEIYEGIHIHRLPFLSSDLGRLNDLFSFPAFFSPVWLKKIRNIVRSKEIDLIMVRDLPLALGALAIGKRYSVPVILDMAECYPELLRLIWKYEPLKFQNVIVRNPYVADVIEFASVKLADHVFVMIEESRERLLRKKVAPADITIVSNTPVLSRFEATVATWPGSMKQHKGKLILLYAGFINYSRGLDTVFRSLKEYLSINENVFLVLLGTGTATADLKRMANDMSIENNVVFEGWVDNKLIPEYVASADVCLVPHHKCSHWDHTIPNKLFDYMAAGKPVLVSNVNPMMRIVKNMRCGLVYEDNNIGSFVSMLSRLQNQELRQQLGERGFNAVKDRYNWEHDSAAMMEAIKKLHRT